MTNNLQHAFNAADVADAVFSSIILHRQGHVEIPIEPNNNETMQTLITSIDDGLKTAGLSFAQYLDRIRQARAISTRRAGQSWRFSAKERAIQRVDIAAAHLCALMQPSSLDS